MGILIFLVPLALLLSAFGAISFIWACKNNQFEDLDGPPTKILFDEKKEDRHE